ncbi:MAG: hypothetical protein LUQ54_00050, partial [Methanoregula sp.]|nr:hypothetical protein [Methanoregula sp.]
MNRTRTLLIVITALAVIVMTVQAGMMGGSGMGGGGMGGGGMGGGGMGGGGMGGGGMGGGGGGGSGTVVIDPPAGAAFHDPAVALDTNSSSD